ncbi:MAG: hypothetical protein AAB381_02725 [Patescibacteria group bacterium]
MNKEIKITKGDLGFTYNSIKSLLTKFGEIDREKHKIKRLIINFDFNEGDGSHLGLSLIWRLMFALKETSFEKLVTYNGSTQSFFKDRHFFDRLVGKKNSLRKNTSIPIHFETFNPSQQISGSDASIDAIFKEVTKKFLDNSNPFQAEIKVHMLEVITNSFDHSDSRTEAVSVCALDPKTGILDFCVVDMGQGVKQSFLRNEKMRKQYSMMSDQEIVARATDFKVSCNPSSARNPKYPYSNGGIGLYFLREFIKVHKDCHLVIISGKGYYYVDSANRIKRRNLLDVNWSGTIVNFRVNVNQLRKEEYIDICQRFSNKD